MKHYCFLILSFSFFIFNCSQHSPVTGKIYDNRNIGLQPLGNIDTATLRFIQDGIITAFHKKVILLQPKKIPTSFVNLSKGERYSADSILTWLNHSRSSGTEEIVAITHKDIFTTIKDAHGKIKEPLSKYKAWGILGLGYQPGGACVISDFRMKTNNLHLYNHRLKSVVIHEIGHNKGLPHCPVERCVMSDAHEKISTVDNGDEDFCEKCKARLAGNNN